MTQNIISPRRRLVATDRWIESAKAEADVGERMHRHTHLRTSLGLGLELQVAAQIIDFLAHMRYIGLQIHY